MGGCFCAPDAAAPTPAAAPVLLGSLSCSATASEGMGTVDGPSSPPLATLFSSDLADEAADGPGESEESGEESTSKDDWSNSSNVESLSWG